MPETFGYERPPSISGFNVNPQITWEMLSPIARETLSEPKTAASAKHRTHIFLGLLKAAHANGMRLRDLEGYGIPWETFHKLEDGSEMFDEILSRLRHLKLPIVHDISKTVGLTEIHRQRKCNFLSRCTLHSALKSCPSG